VFELPDLKPICIIKSTGLQILVSISRIQSSKAKPPSRKRLHLGLNFFIEIGIFSECKIRFAENRTEFRCTKSVLEKNETPKKFWRTAFGENKAAKEFFLSPLHLGKAVFEFYHVRKGDLSSVNLYGFRAGLWR